MSEPTSQRDLERAWWADALATATAERDAARAELEQLRAGLHDEWATRDGGHIDEANIYATEAEAFAALYSGEDVVHRRTGDWIAVGGRVAADAPGTALSATESEAGTPGGAFIALEFERPAAGQTEACPHAKPCPVCDYETGRPT